uniref:C2H2-type domain-containing protein n=1 Tax=Caenorhabditis japonica TaxID=281687 RepID=A0A8R1HUC5_CAEJA
MSLTSTLFSPLTTGKRKSPGELKRPDLQGSFSCGSCGEMFKHASSLNRHRLLRHSDEITCLKCNSSLEANENIRSHLWVKHQIKAFTCSCCNWSFESKKDIAAHNKSMEQTGAPGETLPIAKNKNEPGSLSQKKVLGVAKKVPVVIEGSKESDSESPTPSEAIAFCETLLKMMEEHQQQQNAHLIASVSRIQTPESESEAEIPTPKKPLKRKSSAATPTPAKVMCMEDNMLLLALSALQQYPVVEGCENSNPNGL